jgi:hypothetical protein
MLESHLGTLMAGALFAVLAIYAQSEPQQQAVSSEPPRAVESLASVVAGTEQPCDTSLPEQIETVCLETAEPVIAVQAIAVRDGVGDEKSEQLAERRAATVAL